MCNSTCSCLLSYRLDYYFLQPGVLLDIQCKYLYPSQSIENKKITSLVSNMWLAVENVLPRREIFPSVDS